MALTTVALAGPPPAPGASAEAPPALPELHCPAPPKPAAKPTAKSPTKPSASTQPGGKPGAVAAPPEPADPLELPAPEQVDEALRELLAQGDPGLATEPQDRLIAAPAAGPRTTPFRIGFWGDSHLAAGFFTDALKRLLALPPDRLFTGLLPANLGRPGVRLALRKGCVIGPWRYEPGYAQPSSPPGPGLVNLVAQQTGAALALDLRNTSAQPEHRRLRLLYQQTAAPITLALSLDEGPETELTLNAAPGPAALDLRFAQPASLLRLRLVAGALRWQGLEMPPPEAAPPQRTVQLDVMAYPGATVKGWSPADPAYLGAWFPAPAYDLVLLEFGTNEANDRNFEAGAYRQLLRESLGRLRERFPQAACVLIAPGDRGVLLRRSRVRPVAKAKGLSKGTNKSMNKGKAGAGKHPAPSARAAPPNPPANPASNPPPGQALSQELLRFSRLHAEVGRLQHEIGREFGCGVWSMQTAMGGPGSAYTWVRQNPALMARDLIHFTVAGYQELARRFYLDSGWEQAEWRLGALRP